MPDDRERRLRQILAQAEALAPPDRDRFLREACGGDADLEAEARGLLAALASAGRFLGRPTAREVAPDVAGGRPGREGPGMLIGRYKLLQEIGEGGFGVVYLAEQREPVQRRVAVKIIKPGMDTRQIVARFEAERQALAMMDHPSIARVLDGGATESGRPYFVMELVRGDPITRHCEAGRFDTAQRLELFEQVCRAVQHAHTKGIIHRDLKPGNVLITVVDGLPVPKIIDFGVAKAMNQRLTEKTFFTEHRQLIGTPEYMSPEQADNSGVDVDARTDIYSLGVLLYELLTGVTPFDPDRLRTAAWIEMLRVIREEDPPRPSTRLSSRRAIGPPPSAAGIPVARQVRGDLDWIVMRCLEKERARRYETAEALATDVRRFLTGRPVLAAPPSAAYRARKFARRHRGPVIAAGLLLLAILAGAAGTVAFAVGESRARGRAMAAEATATRRADELQRVAEFQRAQLRIINPAQLGAQIKADLLSETRAALRRSGAPDADARVQSLSEAVAGTNFTDIALGALDRALFGRSLQAIHDQFADQPLVEAALLDAAATTMSAMSLFEPALPAMQEALEIRRHLLGPDHPDTIASLTGLGELLRSMGRLAEAEPRLREALDAAVRVHGRDHAAALTAMSDLATLLSDQHRFDEADPLYREALERSRSSLGEDSPRTLGYLVAQACNLYRRHDLAGAERLCIQGLDRCRRILGPESPDTLELLNALGSTLWAEHKARQAEPYLNEVLAAARRTRGDDNPKTIGYLFNTGAIRRDLGDAQGAEVRIQEAAERAQRVLGRDHPDTALFLLNLAELQLDQREFAQAARSYEAAAAAFQKLYGQADSKTRRADRGWGTALTMLGRFAEAEPHVLAAEAASHGSENPAESRRCLTALVALYENWDAAEPGQGHDAAAARWRARLVDQPGPPGQH